MASKNISGKKTTASRGSGAPKSKELKSEDLDKVVGGLKPTGGVKIGKVTTFSGDPCEGGE
ncbi:MAG TPA: hypothetical protein VMT54_12735 [Candidatus Cybelea sp.]|nr:hypothetical protein [Candidatus Cybelea sp.]